MKQDQTETHQSHARVGFGSVFRNAIVTSLAIILSALWAGFAIVVLFASQTATGLNVDVDADTLRDAVTLIGPILLIWLAAAYFGSSRNTRDHIWALHSELHSLRESLQPEAQREEDAFQEEPLYPHAETEEHAELESPVETEPLTESYEPDPPLASDAESEAQPEVADAEPEYAARMSLPLDTLIRALSFADHQDDTEGFEAIDRAMDDEATAKLLEASQDVLHRLSALDIFVDNLTLDIAQPDVWRFHAANASKSEIATLGAVAETDVLGLVANLVEQDGQFRESAQNLVDQVNDQMMDIIGDADADQVAAFANSRTIRAFILLGNIHSDS